MVRDPLRHHQSKPCRTLKENAGKIQSAALKMVITENTLLLTKLLHLVVQGQDTGTGNTTENVGTSTLEERPDTLGGDDLGTSVHHALVVDLGTGSHHHTTTDSVERVRSETGTGGNGPTKSERGKEVTLKRTNENDGLDRIVWKRKEDA